MAATKVVADLDELLRKYKHDGARDVRRMKARAIPGDELRGYSTGEAYVQTLMN